MKLPGYKYQYAIPTRDTNARPSGNIAQSANKRFNKAAQGAVDKLIEMADSMQEQADKHATIKAKSLLNKAIHDIQVEGQKDTDLMSTNKYAAKLDEEINKIIGAVPQHLQGELKAYITPYADHAKFKLADYNNERMLKDRELTYNDTMADIIAQYANGDDTAIARMEDLANTNRDLFATPAKFKQHLKETVETAKFERVDNLIKNSNPDDIAEDITNNFMKLNDENYKKSIEVLKAKIKADKIEKLAKKNNDKIEMVKFLKQQILEAPYFNIEDIDSFYQMGKINIDEKKLLQEALTLNNIIKSKTKQPGIAWIKKGISDFFIQENTTTAFGNKKTYNRPKSEDEIMEAYSELFSEGLTLLRNKEIKYEDFENMMNSANKYVNSVKKNWSEKLQKLAVEYYNTNRDELYSTFVEVLNEELGVQDDTMKTIENIDVAKFNDKVFRRQAEKENIFFANTDKNTNGIASSTSYTVLPNKNSNRPPLPTYKKTKLNLGDKKNKSGKTSKHKKTTSSKQQKDFNAELETLLGGI